MIVIEGLYKRFGDNDVLNGIELKIPDGKIYAILGPNGSGKTTLIKSVLGLVIPDKGQITVSGSPVSHQWLYRSEINYLSQIANFPGNIRVLELIRMIKDIRCQKSDEQSLIRRLKLEPFLDKKLDKLSGGTKQKVNLLLTFMFDNPILILDEPTSGLDPAALLELKDIIRVKRETGKTIIVTTHILQFVEEMADELIYLLEGDIYFKGSLSELLQKTNQADLEHAIAAITSGRHV
ncbi:ABC transporter ATP-binding protein [Fulvivirga sedimenti]|uniref:ABC transporter ATP-binding protein n=1 Tax=Fulvivirga sedimenti TaxID=2879465 RepID=A0A9X1KXP4_9BACT|nr:ABC transporter ATP-binding protein [Fulvivirga sedimenti]MCA6074387.1 ABC transporter ATP-binding protein [Fulvivirga sedimenti]